MEEYWHIIAVLAILVLIFIMIALCWGCCERKLADEEEEQLVLVRELSPGVVMLKSQDGRNYRILQEYSSGVGEKKCDHDQWERVPPGHPAFVPHACTSRCRCSGHNAHAPPEVAASFVTHAQYQTLPSAPEEYPRHYTNVQIDPRPPPYTSTPH